VTRLSGPVQCGLFQAARQVEPPALNTYACSCFVEQIKPGL